MIAEARAAISDTLKDPESAKFRYIVTVPAERVVCGEVNGKNSFGAYSGYSRFYYRNGSGHVVDYDSIFWDEYVQRCAGPTVQSEIDGRVKRIANDRP